MFVVLLSEDLNSFIVDLSSSLSKLSVVDASKTKATKVGLLEALIQTLMSQPSLPPSLQDFPAKSLDRTAAMVLDGIPKSLYHTPANSKALRLSTSTKCLKQD